MKQMNPILPMKQEVVYHTTKRITKTQGNIVIGGWQKKKRTHASLWVAYDQTYT